MLTEQLADACAASAEMQIASLRLPGVSRENQYGVAQKVDPMARGVGPFWSYVDARDAAAACRLALEAEYSGHEVYNVCAPTTFMNVPTDELLQRYLPNVRCIRKSSKDNWAGYDTSKAERMLGFRAAHLLTL